MGSKDAPQKMQFLGAIKKVASPFTFIQNAKVAENPTYSTVTEAKWIRIPMFLHNLKAYEQGQICICGFMSQICPGKKF